MENSNSPVRRASLGQLLTLASVAVLGWVSPGSSAFADDIGSSGSGHDDLLCNWFAVSDASKEEQPHWMTPVVTVTPRLEQEYRYDQSWQNRPKQTDLNVYGGGKGLELIPTENTEVILGVPAWQTRTTPKGRVDGWADETLLLKYRVATANEENGNYIATGFLGVSVPTGSEIFTNHATIVTPTVALGKGWGSRSEGFDIQSTLGIAIPTGDKSTLGMPVLWNTAFQGHLLEKLWPELEANYTYYKSGPNDGKTQVAVTGGLVAGRFALTPRIKLIIGGGYQQAVSSFRTFNHTWLITARAAF